MTNLPAVDVLLAAYNGAAFIEAQIQSILAQDYQGMIRILIRDDGSSDQTVAIVQRLHAQSLPANRCLVLLQRTDSHAGVSANFSALIAQATAPYVALADQDDVWLPYKIRLQIQAITQAETEAPKPTPLLVCSDLTVVDAQLRPLADSLWRWQRLDPRWAQSWQSLLVQNMVTGCTTLFNQAALAVILPFPSVPGVFHDHWMATAVAFHGQIVALPEQMVLYRQHGQNVEAAQTLTPAYLQQKTAQIRTIIQRSQAMAQQLGVPRAFWSLLWRKLRLNLGRFFL